MEFFISSHQHRLLISDSMSTFQTNAGNIILTLTKLHIRAIHHALSEIGTKRWFSYQGIAIKRDYRGQKLLVESNRKHGFDLKTFISISNYSSSLRRYRGHYLVPLSSRQIQFDGGGNTCFSPLTTTGISLATLISHPTTEGIFTSLRMLCRRERRSFGTVLLKAQLVILSFYKFHSVACDDDLIYPSFFQNEPLPLWKFFFITAFYRYATLTIFPLYILEPVESRQRWS